MSIIGPDGDSVPVEPAGIGSPKALSVVVPQSAGTDVGDCLTSLASQSLPGSQLEVVVARYHVSPARPGAARPALPSPPGLSVRTLDLGAADHSTAVAAAVWAARGRRVLVVGADCWLTPTTLKQLLAHAGERVLPVALTGVAAGGPDDGAAPDLGLPVTTELTPHIGGQVAAHLVPRVLDSFAGVLLPTAAARSALRGTGGPGGPEPLAFWLSVLGAQPVQLHVLRPEEALIIRRDRQVSDRVPDDWSGVVRCLDRVAQIEAHGDHPATRAVARTCLDEVAGALNGYLRRHRADHSRLRSAARTRHLTRIPWSRVNTGLARDLAVLYCFTPFVDTNAIVNARTLYERGWVTDVVTQNLYHRLPRDFLSERIAVEVIDSCVPLDGPADAVEWSVIRDFTSRVLTAVDDLEAAKGPYRSLFSSAMQMPSHFAAAAVKLRRPRLHWIAEFLEPLRRNPDGVDRVSPVNDDWLARELQEAMADAGYQPPGGPMAAFEWAELVPYALADELHFTSVNQLEHMLAYCRDPSLAARVRSLALIRPPSVPAPELYRLRTAAYVLEPGAVNIGYFGAFYGRRGLQEVMNALRLLEPQERERIRLHVFTKPYERMSIEVLRAGLADVVRVAPYVDYLGFLNLITEFDVLLVNDLSTADLPTTNPYLPSKIFDYQGSGRAVWAIQEPGSALSDLPADYVSRLGDVDDALRQLRRMLRTAAPQPGPGTADHDPQLVR